MTEYKFYKLIKNNDCFYVGVTSQVYLSNRMANHRCSFKKWIVGKSRPLYFYSEEFSFDGVKIELIEKGTYENESATRERENELMDIHSVPEQPRNKILNPNYQKEYREDNREKLRKQKEEYYQKNKEVLDQKHKDYCEKNKDKVKDYKAQWNKENREKYYTDEKKEDLKKKRQEKVECDICNQEMTRGSLKRHKDRFHK